MDLFSTATWARVTLMLSMASPEGSVTGARVFSGSLFSMSSSKWKSVRPWANLKKISGATLKAGAQKQASSSSHVGLVTMGALAALNKSACDCKAMPSIVTFIFQKGR